MSATGSGASRRTSGSTGGAWAACWRAWVPRRARATSFLERANVCAYDEAAVLARDGGLPELVGELREMAEVERERERYFREKVASHPLVRALRP